MENSNKSGEEERMNNLIIRNALLDSTVAQLQEQYNCKVASCEAVYRELAKSNNVIDNLKSQLSELELRQKKSLENIEGLKNQVGLLRSLDQSLSQQLQTIKTETREIVSNQQGLLDKYSAKWELYKEKYESLPWRIELRKVEVENKRLNIELKISKMKLIDKENKATLLYKIKCRREQLAIISFATACVNLSKSMKNIGENQQTMKDLEDENNNLKETKRQLLEELSLRTKSNIDKIKYKRDLQQVLHDHRPADKLAPSQSLENKERLQLFKFNFQSKPSGDKRLDSGASHPLNTGFLPGLPDCLKNLFATPSQPLSIQSTPRSRDAAEKPADKMAEREALSANQNLTSKSQQRKRSAASSNLMAPPENTETVNHIMNLPSKVNQTNDNTSQKDSDVLSKSSAENVIIETPIVSTSVSINSQPQKDSLPKMRSKKTLKRSSNFSALKNTSEQILQQNNTSSTNKEGSAKNISKPIQEPMDTDNREATVTSNNHLGKSHPTSLPLTKDDNRSKQSDVNKDNQKVDANTDRGNQNISQSDNESVINKELQPGDNLKVDIPKEQRIIVSPPDIFKRPSPVIVTSRSNQPALKVKGSATQMNKRVKLSVWEESIPQCSQDMFSHSGCSQDSGFSTSQESMDSGDVSQHSHMPSLDVGLKVDSSEVRFRNENESSQGRTDKGRVPIERPSFSGFQKSSFKISPDGQSNPTGGMRCRQGSRFSPNPTISPIMHGNDQPYEQNKPSSNIRPPVTSTPNFPQFIMSPVKSPELQDQQSPNSDDMTPMFNFEAASNVLSPLAPGQSFLNFEANTGECEAFNLFGTNESSEPEGSNIASNFFNFF